jgi:hypothetical protein
LRRARGARCGSRPWVRRGWPQARRRTLKVHATAAPLPHTHTNRLGPHQGGAPLSSRTMGGGERGNSPARLLASTAPLLGLLHPHPSWAPSSNAAPAPSCRLLPSHSQRPPARAPRALACQLEHTEVRRRTAAAGWSFGVRDWGRGTFGAVLMRPAAQPSPPPPLCSRWPPVLVLVLVQRIRPLEHLLTWRFRSAARSINGREAGARRGADAGACKTPAPTGPGSRVCPQGSPVLFSAGAVHAQIG